VAATLKFRIASNQPDPALAQPRSTLQALGFAKSDPGSGFTDIDTFAVLLDGVATHSNSAQAKIANSTFFTVFVTREVGDWLSGKRPNFGFGLTSSEKLATNIADSVSFSGYVDFMLEVDYRN
jgi:hypothetical protein